MFLVTLCLVPCDGLASHPGGGSDVPSHFMLGTLQWTGIPSKGGVVMFLVTLSWVPCNGLASHPEGSSDVPSHFMLGTLRWTSIPSRGE